MDVIRELTSIDLLPEDNERLANLFGQYNEHLRQIERHLGVEINQRGNTLQMIGPSHSVAAAASVLKQLYQDTQSGEQLTPAKIHLVLQETDAYLSRGKPSPKDEPALIRDDGPGRRKTPNPAGRSLPARSCPTFPETRVRQKESGNSSKPFAVYPLSASRAAPKTLGSPLSSSPLP